MGYFSTASSARSEIPSSTSSKIAYKASSRTQSTRWAGIAPLSMGPLGGITETRAEGVENEISSPSQTVAIAMARSITSYGDNLSSDIRGPIKTRRRGEGDVAEVLHWFDCIDFIPTERLTFKEIDGAKAFELRTGDEIEWRDGVDSNPSRATTSTIGRFLYRFPCELDSPETSGKEEDDFRVVKILGIASRGVEGF